MIQAEGVDAELRDYIRAQSDLSVFATMHDALVRKIARSTPGADTGRGQVPFADIFFPGWTTPYAAEIPQLIGRMDEGWWAGFAVALVMATMDNVTTEIKSRLRHADIEIALAAYNAQLRESNLAALYSFLLVRTDKQLAAAWERLHDHAAAREQYARALRTSARLQAASSSSSVTENFEHEMFHHAMKLAAIGMSLDDVESLFADVASRGLPLPANIRDNGWRTFSRLRDAATIAWTDVSGVAKDPLTRQVSVPQGVFGEMGESFEPEYYAVEFSASSQPGGAYRNRGGA